MTSERGLSPSELLRVKQRDHGEIIGLIKQRERLKNQQEQGKKSRQLLQAAEDIFRKFPHDTIFNITTKVDNQDVTQQVLVYYPPQESKKDFIDSQTGRIIIQNPDGRHQRPIGLVNFIEQAGIGKVSEDRTFIEPNRAIIDEYKNQQLLKLVVD